MLFHVSCELEYTAQFPIDAHPERPRPAQRRRRRSSTSSSWSSRAVKVSEFTPDGSDNRFIRLKTGRHKKLAITYSASVECDFQTYSAGSVEATPVAELSGSTIPYLFPEPLLPVRPAQPSGLGSVRRHREPAREGRGDQPTGFTRTSSTCAAAPTR